MAKKKSAEPTEAAEKKAQPWTQRLHKMKKVQDKFSKTWSRNEQLIFGGPGKMGALGAMTPQEGQNELAYGWGLVKALETSIYIQNPTPIIEALHPENKQRAKALTSIVRYDMDCANLKALGNLMISDCFLSGYGAIIEVLDNEKGPVRYMDETTGEEVSEERLTDQHYTWRRIIPKDILFDPAGKLLDLSDHRYIAVAFYPTVQSLKEDSRFHLPEDIDEYPESSEGTRQDSTKGPGVSANSINPHYTGEKNPEYRTICVWEIHDKVAGKILYMPDAGTEIIGEIDWPTKFQIGARRLFPVTLMAFHPQPKEFYPKAEIDLIAPQLLELNALERMMRQDSMTKWRKYVTWAGVLGKTQIAQICDSSIENGVIEIDYTRVEEIVGNPQIAQQMVMEPGKIIAPVEDVSMKRDLPVRKQMIEADISHILGYGPADRGGLPSTRSAREAMMINESKNQRLTKRLDCINDFYRDLIAKHIMLMQATLDIKRYARITDRGVALNDFVAYSKGDIEGQFNYDVIPGSSGPKTTESRKAAELQLFQTLAPLLMQSGLSIKPAFDRLAYYYDWEDTDELWKNVKGETKAMAALLFAFSQGQAKPEQLLEQATKVVMAGLSQGELGEVQKAVQGQGIPGPGGQPAPTPQGLRGDPNALGTAAGRM